MKKIFTLLLILIVAKTSSFAQFSIAATNTTYTEDFALMSTAGTWTNNTTPITGWYARTDATASITTFGLNTGSTTTAGLYSFGVAGTNALSDKSLGYAASNAFTGSNPSKGYFGWRLKNNTGGTLESITITYDGEQWRKENNASTNSLTVEYQTGTTVTDLTAGTWTSAGAGLTFTTPIVGATTATSLDGNAPANRVADLTATVTFGSPLAAGDEVMIRWVDLNDSGNDHMITIDNVRIIAQAPQPISLLKFEAEKLAEKVKISWTTATEMNNDKFIIERSADGKEFAAVAELKGAGNSKEINAYELIDENPLKGTSYYRLTQVDFDGRSESFAPVAVKMNAKNLELHAWTANEGTINLNVYSPSSTNTEIIIRDLSGRTIVSEKVTLVEGYQQLNIDANILSSGIHFIQLMNAEGVVMKKLVL